MNNSKMRWTLVGSVAVAALALTGCSGTASPDKSGSTALSVGIVNFDTTSITANSFAVQGEKGMKAHGWNVLVQDSKGDPAQGNTICTQYVTRGVDAIFVNVFEQSQMGQCESQASAAKIPVFYIGSLLAKGMAGALSTIVPDPINNQMLDDLKGKSKVSILELGYTPGAPCRVRSEQLASAISSKIDVSTHEVTIPGQVLDAQNATAAWLTAHPASQGETLAIWACFSDPAVGAIAAIAAAGRSDIPVYTWDLTKQAVDYIRSGDIAATLWVDAAGMSKQMISLVENYKSNGKAVQVEAANKVITADNIDAFLKDNPDAAQ